MPAWKLASGGRGETERNKMKKALHDFFKDFGEGWETQTSELHGIDRSAEGDSRQLAGGRKECQGTDQEEKFCSIPSPLPFCFRSLQIVIFQVCFGKYRINKNFTICLHIPYVT